MANNKTEIRWVRPPSKMARDLEIYGDRVLAAVQAVADLIAARMQNAARKNAPWEDRTGNARSGLFAVATREAARDIVAIYLSHGHTIYYGIYLETSFGGKYAIIMPTIEEYLPELKRLLDKLFS